MRKLAIGLVAVGALVTATALPAAAQVGVYAGPGGVGVGVGPFGAGIGPGPYGYDRPYRDGYYDYAGPRYIGPGRYDGHRRWHDDHYHR